MNFRILTLENKKEWSHTLAKVQAYDFYHTPSYHSLSPSGKPKLLVFEDQGNVVAIPLLFHQIPNTDYWDVNSVYGYTGWIRTADFYPESIFKTIEDYFFQQKIVSAFSRLHPLIEGSAFFQNAGEVECKGVTTGINLLLPEEDQTQAYSESVRRSIRKAQRQGVHVRLATSISDIRCFKQIYESSMRRLQAKSHYFFSEDYFLQLLNADEYSGFILLAEYENKPIAGGLFIVCDQIMQYHLGAVDINYVQYSPLKQLIEEARLIANQRNLQTFHLGGGYGGERDNLFIFKSRMTTNQWTFKVWKWIVNDPIYNELSFGKQNNSFFPAYRD